MLPHELMHHPPVLPSQSGAVPPQPPVMLPRWGGGATRQSCLHS